MAAYTYDYGLGLGAPIQSDKFRITSWVGPRARFATSGGQHSSTSHAGVDIATPVGTNLLAPMSGKVIHVVNMNDGTNKRNQRGYGNQVVIQRDDGVITQQSHLFDVNVKVGDRVQQGLHRYQEWHGYAPRRYGVSRVSEIVVAKSWNNGLAYCSYRTCRRYE